MKAHILYLLVFSALTAFSQVVPPPATQAEVDAGVNRFKYVTPLTLNNWTGGGGGALPAYVLTNNDARATVVFQNGVLMDDLDTLTAIIRTSLTLPNFPTNAIPYIGANGAVSTTSFNGLTLTLGTLSTVAPGVDGGVIFNEGGALAATNKLIYDRDADQLIITNNSSGAALVLKGSSPRQIRLYIDGGGRNVFEQNATHPLWFQWDSSPSWTMFTNGLSGAASNSVDLGTWGFPVRTNWNNSIVAKDSIQIIPSAGAGKVLTSDGSGIGTWQTPSASGGASGGFVSGVSNIGYTASNQIPIDLSVTNYSVYVITNTGGPVYLGFTNFTVGFNFTVFVDGADLDGTTSASNMLVYATWPHSSVAAQWMGFTTNTYVTSNKVLGITGFIRRTNSIILSSRE